MDCDIDFTDQLLMAWLMAGRPKHVCVRAQCVKIWQLPICGFFQMLSMSPSAKVPDLISKALVDGDTMPSGQHIGVGLV